METGSFARLKKDPDAVNWPKGIDWTKYLARIDADELLTASTWSIDGPDDDLEVVTDSIVTGNLKTQVRLSGGTDGKEYTVTNHITTTSGVEDDRSFTIVVGER